MILFFVIFIIAGAGLAMVYSASAVPAMRNFGSPYFFLRKQLLWFIVGFAALVAFQMLDYRVLTKYTRILLAGAVGMLAILFIPGIGHLAKGSVRWIAMGPFTLQPSEFVKVIMVIYLAKIFSAEPRKTDSHIMQFVVPMVFLALLFILIIIQPDFGSAIVLMMVSVAIIFASGFPLIYMLTLAVLSVPAFYLLVYQVQYRWDRVLAFFDPWHDRYGIGYHIIQSFTAFKSGGLHGVGLGYGTMKLARLPEPHTDFIFAVIAEEAGFLGTSIIVILFLLLFWRGVKIAFEAPDNFGKLLALGLSMLVTIQAFINIAVVSGSLPTTGVPLPFISYGGSAFLSNMIACGILLSISRSREVVRDAPVHPGESGIEVIS